MSDLLPCRFCDAVPEPEIRRPTRHTDYNAIGHECLGPYRATPEAAAAEWNAANAATDPALLATHGLRDATDEEVAELEEEVREASARVAELESEYALARFGAYVVRDWFRRASGFQAADGHQLDAAATETGVVTHGATVGFRCSPGIASAIARLLAPDGADGVREVTDG